MINAEIMGRRFDAHTYHCAHFAVDVWWEITGQDLRRTLSAVLASPEERTVLPVTREGFEELDGPQEPCLVLMRRPDGRPHLGVYVGRRVLHMRDTGPFGATLGQIRDEYRDVRYFRCTD